MRTAAPDRLSATLSRGLSVPIVTWGTSSSPSSTSITTPVAPVSPRLRSAITRMTVAESSPAAATACWTSMTAWNSSVSSRISSSASFRSVMSNSVPRYPTCRPGLVADRLPGAGAPALLAGAGDHPVLLVAEGAALRQPLPFGQQRRAIVGVDVLEELLVAQVLRRRTR